VRGSDAALLKLLWDFLFSYSASENEALHHEPAHWLSPSATASFDLARPGLAPPLMTTADDMYTAAADTEEEDIDYFLPPPPTTSLLEMCGSTISATQPVPIAHLYDYHY